MVGMKQDEDGRWYMCHVQGFVETRVYVDNPRPLIYVPGHLNVDQTKFCHLQGARTWP